MSNRIKPEDITPYKCYYCFKSIESDRDLKLFNILPYHKTCLRDAMLDKQRYNLINDLLDHWQLYQDDSFIRHMFYDIDDAIQGYKMHLYEDRISTYILTKSNLFITTSTFDYSSKEDESIAIPIQHVEHLRNLLNQ